MRPVISIILQQKCFIKPDDVLVVGVSGGADSIYLAQTLLEISQPIIVAHYNHGIRETASADADFVRNYAHDHNINFVLEKGDVYDFAQQKKISLEVASRILRYDFLFRVAKESDAKAVAVAHHADDQVETLLLNLLRGTGLRGLTGMQYRWLPNPWSKSIPLVRPLLGLYKSEIINELTQKGVPFRIDETNDDVSFLRNRIRHEIIPVLSSARSDVKLQMLKMAENLSLDYEYIQTRIEEETKGMIVVGKDHVSIDQSRFCSLHVALQRHTIAKLLYERFFSAVEIDQQLIERILRWMTRSSGTGRQVLSGNLYLYRERGKVYLYTAEAESELPLDAFPQLHSMNEEIIISIPDEMTIGDGWHLTVKLVDYKERLLNEIKSNTDEYTAYLGFFDKPSAFMVRARKPGDRIAPLGMGGNTISLKKYMINHKIPRRVRNRFPLIVYQGEIVWVPGYGISDRFKVDASAKWVCTLRMYKP